LQQCPQQQTQPWFQAGSSEPADRHSGLQYTLLSEFASVNGNGYLDPSLSTFALNGGTLSSQCFAELEDVFEGIVPGVGFEFNGVVDYGGYTHLHVGNAGAVSGEAARLSFADEVEKGGEQRSEETFTLESRHLADGAIGVDQCSLASQVVPICSTECSGMANAVAGEDNNGEHNQPAWKARHSQS
jgi:hypothetical protein